MEPETRSHDIDTSSSADKKDVRLLILVHSLSILYILESIMHDLNKARGEKKLHPVKPCEVFDLVGGIDGSG